MTFVWTFSTLFFVISLPFITCFCLLFISVCLFHIWLQLTAVVAAKTASFASGKDAIVRSRSASSSSSPPSKRRKKSDELSRSSASHSSQSSLSSTQSPQNSGSDHENSPSTSNHNSKLAPNSPQSSSDSRTTPMARSSRNSTKNVAKAGPPPRNPTAATKPKKCKTVKTANEEIARLHHLLLKKENESARPEKA